jgi:hypothetical protein
MALHTLSGIAATVAFAPEPTAGAFRGKRTAGSAPARGTGARLVPGVGATVVCRVAGAGGVVAFVGVAGGVVVVVGVALAVSVVVVEPAAGDVARAGESG